MEQVQTTPDHSLNGADMAQKMEDEHFRLQRQVRVIQADRNDQIGVHPQFRRQDQQLSSLKQEYLDLRKDLKIARSGSHKKNDRKLKADLKRAVLLRSMTLAETEGGVNLMNELDGLIQLNKKNLLQLRRTVSNNIGQLEERRFLSERRLLSTENQLEIATLRFNAVQWENRNIREEIEHMLKDRATFKEAWTKMLTALGKGKKFLTDLFESSTVAYDQRDEWCRKLKSLQEKGKMDQMTQMQEMRDLQKSLDHEMKLFEFLACKGVMRVNRKQEMREALEKQKEEKDLKEQIQYHDKILEQVFDYTGKSKIIQIINDFERKEQENLAVYKLLAHICAEIEVLSREVNGLRRDVVDRRDWNEKKENERQVKLQKIAQELEAQQKKTEELRKKRQVQDMQLNTTMQKVIELFKLLQCSLEPYANLLGDKQPSLWNLNLVFSLMTEKIKEHIETVYYHEHVFHKKDKSSTSRLKKFTIHPEIPLDWEPERVVQLVPNDPCPNCVEARWMSRVTETAEAPLDHAQTLEALAEIRSDPAYLTSDRLHPLADCRLPASRLILARRYMPLSKRAIERMFNIRLHNNKTKASK